MPAAYDLRTAFVVLLLLAGGAPAATEDIPPQPNPGERLGRILDEWQRRSAEWTSLDVRFTVGSSVGQPTIGRVILQPGRAVVSLVRQREDNMDAWTERLIWKGDALHQIRPESKEHVVTPIAVEDRDRLPAVLALPFLWNTSVERLTQRYRVELLKEVEDGYLLEVTPLTKRGRSSFSKALLHLSRATYLPRRFLVYSPDGKASTDYRVTETHCNQAIPDEVFRVPEGDGWRRIRTDQSRLESWLSRLYQPDLLP